MRGGRKPTTVGVPCNMNALPPPQAPMAAPNARDSKRGLYFTRALAIAATVGLLVAVAAWFQTSTDLGTANQLLSEASSAADQAQDDVTDARATVAEQSRKLSEASASRAALESCVADLSADFDALIEVAGVAAEHASLMGADSAFVKAVDKRYDLQLEVADHYYDAASAAWDSRYSEANDHVAKGNAAREKVDAQTEVITEQFRKALSGYAELDDPDATFAGFRATRERCRVPEGTISATMP